MSGEHYLKLLGLSALILICAIFIIASGANADEGEVKIYESTYLLDQANDFQLPDGSWDRDINITAKLTVANYWASTRFDNDTEYSIKIHFDVANLGTNWTLNNYHKDVSVETVSIIYLSLDTEFCSSDSDGYVHYKVDLQHHLITAQQPDGSWNNKVSDTALTTYALNKREVENREAVERGLFWLKEQEDEDEFTWGSIEDDSKSILALDNAGAVVWKEISGLMLKQSPDGSFGGIEDTAWATMALSTQPNKEAADKAMSWLRSQNYENNNDLAMAALAEQFYEKVKFERETGEKGGSSFILPPLLYAVSLFIIGSLVLSYWLFARLDRNEILDGIRKDIYAYIAEHPGEHLANITKTLDLSSGSARYHLSVLEGTDKIVSHKNGKYKRYYVNKNGYGKYMNGNGYKHIMSALKNHTARKIVKFLISNPESNQKSVSSALKISPSTVNWHANRLREAEIINKHRKGKEIMYSLNQDVQLKKVIGIIEGSFA